MRQLFFALALALSACATPPARADTVEADTQLLRACVAQAGVNRAALSQCVGRVTRACVELQGDPNSLTEVLCRSAEIAVWRTYITEATIRITAADAASGELLAVSSESWATWLQDECNYRSYQLGSGAGAQVDRAICELHLTSERAIDLMANY